MLLSVQIFVIGIRSDIEHDHTRERLSCIEEFFDVLETVSYSGLKSVRIMNNPGGRVHILGVLTRGVHRGGGARVPWPPSKISRFILSL